LATITLAATLGCRQDMHDQPKFFPQRGTSFYADGRSVRPQAENTVARSQAHPDSYFATGLVDGKEGDGLPFPVTAAVLERGQERYNVYCTPCHSRVGNGEGMAVLRGYAKAGDFHTTRLRQAPLGHFFHVISSGYGAMPDYAAQVTPSDRWAIVAYIRALQLSQSAQSADVPAGHHVEPLKAIAERDGYPVGFAAEPKLPGTVSTGTPDGQPFVLPSPGATTAPAAAKPQTPGAATQK
jgi:mono/diheme cytochrome c family protein